MKKIILMCLFGLMFSQAKLETRLYEVSLTLGSSEEVELDLNQMTGYDLENPVLYLQSLDVDVFDNNDQIGIWFKSQYVNAFNGINQVSWEQFAYINLEGHIYRSSHTHPMPQTNTIVLKADQLISGTFGFSITAEFPIEDTGYIEEGFDFCLHSGQNLVSFPCENSVSVETALPELAQAEITSIIGEGVASTYINGQFLGSLQNFSPGAGYWFKSNSSMCFNYTCSE